MVADKKLLIIFGKRFKMLYLCGLKITHNQILKKLWIQTKK